LLAINKEKGSYSFSIPFTFPYAWPVWKIKQLKVFLSLPLHNGALKTNKEYIKC